MKEFLKKILNGIFPGVPTKTAGWITLAFLIVLIAGIVILCIWAKKTSKKEVEDVNISKEDQQEETNQTEKVEENTEVEKVEEPVVEEKAEQTETTEEEPKEEEKEVVMKEEKKTTKQAKETKTETVAEKKPAKVKEEEKPVEETEQAEEVKVKNQKYMVVYDKEKKDWVIKKTGAAKASKRCKTKKEALEFVEKYAENQDLNVSIKKKDGKFQKKY